MCSLCIIYIEKKKQNSKSDVINLESRLAWDEYFLKMAFLVAERSTCLRRHVGAVIVKDNKILATGYNGAGSGIIDCTQVGCIRDKLNVKSGERHEICNAIHAEQNVIIQVALHGGHIADSTIYCTHSPCMLCAKMMVNAKIKKAVYCYSYAEESFLEIFKQTGIDYINMTKPNLMISTKV